MAEPFTMGAAKLFDPENLRSVSTTRTYPVEAERFACAVEEAVWALPRWRLAQFGERQIRTVRETRVFGFEDDVTIPLTTASSSSASTNT